MHLLTEKGGKNTQKVGLSESKFMKGNTKMRARKLLGPPCITLNIYAFYNIRVCRLVIGMSTRGASVLRKTFEKLEKKLG